MNTTIKVSKKTNELLKAIADERGRRESKEQVILELIAQYEKGIKRRQMYDVYKEP